MTVLKLTYFELYDISVNITLDLSELNSKYLKLQTKFHPDKYSNSSAMEKSMAARISTHINDGYKVLGNLTSRVDYILKINNFTMDENKTFKNNQFLIEQMELTEKINKSNQTQQDDIKNYIKEKISSLILDMKDNLSNKDFDILYENNSMIKFYKKNINQLSK
jgi:molecular chaperone HscB